MANFGKYWPLIAVPVFLVTGCGRSPKPAAAKAPSAAPPAPAADSSVDDIDPPSPYATYSKVENGLYVGGRVAQPPAGTHAVLSLTYNKDVYTVPDDAWHPIPDGPPAPSLDWLKKQVAFVNKERRAGYTTYIHCDAGVSRGPMVTIAYLMYEHHWTRDQALEFVRQSRPFVGPNVYFMDLLLDWEDALKASGGAMTMPAG